MLFVTGGNSWHFYHFRACVYDLVQKLQHTSRCDGSRSQHFVNSDQSLVAFRERFLFFLCRACKSHFSKGVLSLCSQLLLTLKLVVGPWIKFKSAVEDNNTICPVFKLHCWSLTKVYLGGQGDSARRPAEQTCPAVRRRRTS